MKRITAALLFLLTIPGLAHAQTQTTRDSYWTGYLAMCEDGLGGRPFPEVLTLIGTERFSFRTLDNGTQKIIELLQYEIKGKATGTITGNEYLFHTQGKSRTVFSRDPENEVEIILHGGFTIPQLGYKARSNTHITFGTDGEMIVDVRNIRMDCPTTP